MGTLTQREPATSATLIALEGVEQARRTGKLDYRALRGVDLIEAGEMVAIVRPPGSRPTVRGLTERSGNGR